jgi:hypothetical protein
MSAFDMPDNIAPGKLSLPGGTGNNGTPGTVAATIKLPVPNSTGGGLQLPARAAVYEVDPFGASDDEDMSAFDGPTVPHTKLSLPGGGTASATSSVRLAAGLLGTGVVAFSETSGGSQASSTVTSPANTNSFTARVKEMKAQQKTVDVASFAERDDETFDDFADFSIDSHKLSSKKTSIWDGGDHGAEAQERLDDIFNDADASYAPKQDDTRNFAEIKRLVQQLKPHEDSSKLLQNISRLMELLTLDAHGVHKVMNEHGVIPIMEMLENPDPVVILPLLDFAANVMIQNPKFSQSLCLLGLVPAVIKFAGQSQSDEVP